MRILATVLGEKMDLRCNEDIELERERRSGKGMASRYSLESSGFSSGFKKQIIVSCDEIHLHIRTVLGQNMINENW